ncbi:MAG: DUF192 domain-containing protein [Phycisphaerae bacterium]|nr:DUF192 domain-containing protein [Phycisphaerae bacterium]
MRIPKSRNGRITLTVLVLFVLTVAGVLAALTIGEYTGEGVIRVAINGRTFTAEIADAPETLKLGLMFRNSLPERHGMLFVFPDAAPRAFWMKNTLIPLDIIFIGADRRILNVETLQAQSEKRAYSAGPARYTLELAARSAQRYGLEPGMPVEFDLPERLHSSKEQP